jgi:NADP-dependent 3-hydroxy acid dehydrogenase YdfG
MTRGILIAGIESSLSAAIAAEAGKRVERYAAAFIPNRLSEASRDKASAHVESPALIPITWNPGSPISARTLVLAAQNRLEHIDDAILICTPPVVRKQVDELAPGDIETVVNDHIKGWFFLAKELAAAFKSRNTGTLALVLSESGTEGDLMGPSAAASFRAFTQGLLSQAAGKPYHTLAFSSDTADDGEFAAFIFKVIEEGPKRNVEKWHKYGKQGLGGLFNRKPVY